MIALALVLAMQHQHGPGMEMPRAVRPIPKPSSRRTQTHKEPDAGERATPPEADCAPEHAAMGHCTPAPAAAPTAGSLGGTDQPAGDAPPPRAPRVDYAGRIHGAEAMRAARTQLYREHGGGRWSQVMIDLAELQFREGRDGYRWDGEAWFGGDRDRLVLKTEGRGDFGRGVDDAELQALFSRAVGPYFDVQAGVRYDIRPDPSRAYATLAIEGLAPYWFDVEAALFLSDRGDLLGRAEARYDQRITQRLILQPRAEANLSAQRVGAAGLGRGVTDLELGLRLRYELRREFAPYVGVSWDRRFGRAARSARAAGEGASDVSLVAGIRTWF